MVKLYSSEGSLPFGSRKGETDGRNLDWRVYLILRGPESDVVMR